MLHSLGAGKAGLSVKAPPQYLPETRALLAAMTVPPSLERAALIDRCVRALIASGVWSRLDGLYVMAAHDAQAARVNWVSPGNYNLIAVNSPAFEADHGYSGNGSSAYLETGFSPVSAGGRYTQDDAHLGVWCRTPGAVAVPDTGGSFGTVLAWIYCDYSNGHAVTYLNSLASGGALSSAAVVNGDEHIVASRADSANVSLYIDGEFDATAARASGPIGPGNMQFGRAGNGFSARQFCVGHMGASLSAGDNAALDTALRAYLVAVGAV